MSDKIQFLCPYCRTQLAVATQYAGEQAKCPGCNAIVPVPLEDLDETASYTPSFSSLSANTSTVNQSTSAGQSPNFHDSLTGVPTNQENQFGDSRRSPPTTPSNTSFGKSFLGLLSAIVVGFLCTGVWLTVAVIFQVEIGILAWAIGALIGFVAGSIAKNPSGVYCFLVSCVAGFSILSPKIIMVLFFMIASLGVDLFENIQNQLLSNKYEHAFVDQQLADNQYPPEKATIAAAFNNGYFEQTNGPNFVINGREISNIPGGLTAEDPSMGPFRKEVREAVASASKEEKETWIENARKRHPNWIVELSHATAAKILLVNDPGKLDDDLKRHALFEIRSSDFLLQPANQSDQYLADTPEKILKLRSDTLKTLVIAKLKDLDTKDLKELTKEAVSLDPSFVADEIGFIAILDNLLAKGELPPELLKHATGRMKTVTDVSFSAGFFSNLGEQSFIDKEIAIRKIVAPIWAASTQDEIELRISETQLRHPKWNPDGPDSQWLPADDLQEKIGDGTLAGSVKKVFSFVDLFWLFLGAVSAFGTARSRADHAS